MDFCASCAHSPHKPVSLQCERQVTHLIRIPIESYITTKFCLQQTLRTSLEAEFLPSSWDSHLCSTSHPKNLGRLSVLNEPLRDSRTILDEQRSEQLTMTMLPVFAVAPDREARR